jgi:hypothetical protein
MYVGIDMLKSYCFLYVVHSSLTGSTRRLSLQDSVLPSQKNIPKEQAMHVEN